MHAQPERKTDHEATVAWLGRERPAAGEPESAPEPAGTAGDRPQRPAAGSILRHPPRRVAIVLGLLALVLLAAWLALRPSAGPAVPGAARGPSVPLVTVMSPGRIPVSSSVSFTGTIRARHEMPVGAEGEGGPVASVHVDIGDRVRRGELLATLDTSVIAPQVARLEAELEEARATADLRAAEYERARGVAAAGALSAEEIERRRAASITAEAQVRVAAAQLREARARLARTQIRAPDDGVVLTRDAEVGQNASPGEPLFRLARDGQVEMVAQVAEQDLPRLEVGQPATVRLTGVDAPFEGKVRLLGAVIDPQTRLGEVRIALAAHPNLRPGAFARGEITVASSERPVLPQTAVLSDGRGAYVYIVNGDDHIERRDVRIAATGSRGVVIAEGLSGNERVVTTAGAFLREGEQVRPTGQEQGTPAQTAEAGSAS